MPARKRCRLSRRTVVCGWASTICNAPPDKEIGGTINRHARRRCWLVGKGGLFFLQSPSRRTRLGEDRPARLAASPRSDDFVPGEEARSQGDAKPGGAVHECRKRDDGEDRPRLRQAEV